MKTKSHESTTESSAAPVAAGVRRLKLNSRHYQFRLKRGLPLAFLLLALGASLAHAATVTWTNTTGGNWSVAANWSPNTVPAAADTVLITQAGTYTVMLDASATITSLTLGAGSGQQRLTNSANTLTISGSATIAANGVLDLAGGGLSGASLWQVNSSGVLNWSGGSMEKALTVAVGGVLNLGGTGQRALYQPLTNWGTINWTNSELYLHNNGSGTRGAIYNQTGALFDVQCDQSLTIGSGSEFIANAGTFRKSAATGTTTIQTRFDNTGTVEAAKGMIQFSGSYTSAPTSNLRFILSGTTAGTGFGQVRFGTALVSEGIVSGEVANGFNPPAGSRFQVISGGLADTPLCIDRNAGNGYVFDFFGTGDALTLVTRPGHFTLPPLLSLYQVRPGIWSFLMEGAPGLTYRIQAASELREAPPREWTTISTNTTPSGLVQLLITNTVAPQQFYRAVTP